MIRFNVPWVTIAGISPMSCFVAAMLEYSGLICIIEYKLHIWKLHAIVGMFKTLCGAIRSKV